MAVEFVRQHFQEGVAFSRRDEPQDVLDPAPLLGG
jgi:hypothetical protein